MEYLLVVEDDKDIRESLQDILELVGYKVSTANNGREAFDSILANLPDLVLCDIDMPILDGFELLMTINQRLKGEIIPPFIFLTAKVEMQNIRQGMGLGADDYILKPFNHNELLNIIRLRLNNRSKLLQKGKPSTSKIQIDTFEKLALPTDDGLELVPFDQIIKCRASRSYCTFELTKNRSILVSKPMKEFETVLLREQFFKIHKSTIVNLKHIEKYIRGKGGYLLLSDGSKADVSVRKKDELMKRLQYQP
jgi:two-component system LytT family response regulator